MTAVAYLVSHPIQYQARMLRLLAEKDEIDLLVYFRSDFSSSSYFDPGFNAMVEWDVPLLEGYDSVVLPQQPPGPGRLLRCVRDLFARLDRQRPDVLWVHGYATPFYALVIELALRRGMKVLIRDDSHRRGNRRVEWRERLKRAVVSSWSIRGAGFLAIGSLNRDYYLENGAGREQIFMAPYAVDNAFFAEHADQARRQQAERRRTIGVDSDATVVLFAAKYVEQKLGLDLIAAFRTAYPDLIKAGVSKPTLVFAGAGTQEAELRHAAEDLPCVVLGFQNQSQLAALFGLSDLFVLPARHESWGLVVNEAMAAGLPVIVSDEVGCWPDLVEDDVTGYVFPVGDRNALAAALVRALSDRQKLEAMGHHSRARIGQWSFEQSISGILTGVRALAAKATAP